MELGFDAILYSTLGNENSERKYAYYVNKRRQNVSLETWIWRHKQRTPNTNEHHMPLNETPIKIFCVRHWYRKCKEDGLCSKSMPCSLLSLLE